LTHSASHTIEDLQQRGPLPKHVAVIMDGNGRWAKERGLPRVEGHRQGVHAVRDTTEACAELGIPHLTLYTFSTENWKRPMSEISALMKLLIQALKREARTFHENDIKLNAIGSIDELPEKAQQELSALIEETKDNTRMTLTLALSYSGKWDLTQAMRSLAVRVREGALDPADIDQDVICNQLSTVAMPDPDLLIRTGGEKRISNYMLWQMAYTELYFTSVFWPDFRRQHLFEAVKDFQDRERRFGGVLTEK
jgi:undecaprenyl diphosphate synthase